jgi:hypothetical protein
MNIIFNFVIFVATKKGRTTNFFHPSLLLLFLDPRSGIDKNQDPGSGINIPDPQHCFEVLMSGIVLSLDIWSWHAPNLAELCVPEAKDWMQGEHEIQCKCSALLELFN